MDTADLPRRAASPRRTLVPGAESPAIVMAVSEGRTSRSTSPLTTANRKLADNPHISTPMMLSTGTMETRCFSHEKDRYKSGTNSNWTA